MTGWDWINFGGTILGSAIGGALVLLLPDGILWAQDLWSEYRYRRRSKARETAYRATTKDRK